MLLHALFWKALHHWFVVVHCTQPVLLSGNFPQRSFRLLKRSGTIITRRRVIRGLTGFLRDFFRRGCLLNAVAEATGRGLGRIWFYSLASPRSRVCTRRDVGSG